MMAENLKERKKLIVLTKYILQIFQAIQSYKDHRVWLYHCYRPTSKEGGH